MGTQLGAYLEMTDDYFILIMKNMSIIAVSSWYEHSCSKTPIIFITHKLLHGQIIDIKMIKSLHAVPCAIL